MVRGTGIALAAAVVGLIGVTGEASAQYAGGSYRRSCTNINQDGPILEADCRDVRGGYRSSQLDLRRCGGSPVANTNGRLTCGGGGGGGFGEGGGYGRQRDYDERRGPPAYDPYGRPPPPRY